MEPRKAFLIELKRNAGLATPAEVEALESAPLVIGDGLVVRRWSPCEDSWLRRYGDMTQERLCPAGPEDTPEIADDA